MRTNFKIAMVLLTGVAIGAIAVQGLHAQGAKLKAYAISELETLDASAQAAYLPARR
jgi:tRNA A37 threonylcarbamoyladenosine modification protein TsaB